MKRVVTALCLSSLVAISPPAVASDGHPVDLTTLARGSERIVVATIVRVEPRLQTNEFGDQLIVSRSQLRVDAVLKRGHSAEDAEALVVEVEGGTIGDLTLAVSDLPRVAGGERAVWFLRKNDRGVMVPQGRGQGILKLDSSDRVQGTTLTLAAVRQAVERAR